MGLIFFTGLLVIMELFISRARLNYKSALKWSLVGGLVYTGAHIATIMALVLFLPIMATSDVALTLTAVPAGYFISLMVCKKHLPSSERTQEDTISRGG